MGVPVGPNTSVHPIPQTLDTTTGVVKNTTELQVMEGGLQLGVGKALGISDADGNAAAIAMGRDDGDGACVVVTSGLQIQDGNGVGVTLQVYNDGEAVNFIGPDFTNLQANSVQIAPTPA